MPTPPRPTPAVKLLSNLESSVTTGKFPREEYEVLAQEVDSLYGDGNRLGKARSSVMAWESTLREQGERVERGEIPASRISDTAYCLQSALSELAKLEHEGWLLVAALWAAIAKTYTNAGEEVHGEA